jgi:hypothetical protein
LISAVLVIGAACSGLQPQDPSLDGWPLGSPVSCRVQNDNQPAYDFVALATAHLGSWQRPIVDATCYTEGGYLDNGQPILTTRSTLLVVVAFTFDDRSRHAIGIACPADSACRQAKPAP